jgi:surface protein
MTLALHEMLIDGLPRGPFLSTWRTAAAGETVTLPLSGGAGSGYDFVVDWGDGIVEAITSATDPKRIHTYAAAGDHQIKITGTLVGWAFFSVPASATKIRTVDQWGCLRFTPTQNGHFRGCTNLTVPATDAPQLSASCANMFFQAFAFNQPINHWDMSSVKTVNAMFYEAKLFNQPIGSWNVSSATDFGNMFKKASAFNQDLSGWRTISAVNMNSMFEEAANFNGLVNTWSTSKVTNFSYMFFYAQKFNQDVNGWNTSAALNMSNMFKNASAFNKPVNGWDVSSVTNMNAMFNNASVFNQPLNLWNITKVADLGFMFSRAYAFNQDISGWNTAAVTSMDHMFLEASKFNCGQAAGVVHTLMKRTASGGWRIGGITSAKLINMFNNATAFAGDISTWCADAATTLPTNFASSAHANFTPALQPTWGACPIPD